MHKKKTFNSWDRFLLPLPFATAYFVFGEPIRVDPRAGREEIEARRLELERVLNELTRRAGALAGGE